MPFEREDGTIITPGRGTTTGQGGYNSPDARLQAVVQTSSSTRPQRTRSFTMGGSRAPEKETLDDLEVDDQFQEDAQIFLEHLGTNDDIFETLRDSDYNIVGALHRASTSGNWPEEVKQAYGRLRTRFDGAKTGSFNQWMEATKDIGIDIISDPTLIASVLAAPFTGGSSLGARQAAVQGTRLGAKRWIASKLGTTAVLGAAEGAVWTGTDDWARQKTMESVGLQDSVRASQVIASAAVGGLLGGAVGKFVDYRATRGVALTLNETPIEEISRLDRVLFPVKTFGSSFSAHTVGKPASVLNPITKISPTANRLQKLFNRDLGRAFSNPLNPSTRSPVGRDFHGNVSNITGKYLERYKIITRDIGYGNTGRLMNDVNETLATALRSGAPSGDEAIDRAASQIRRLLDDMGDEQIRLKLLNEKVPNYLKRAWNREAIEENQEGFRRLLIEAGQVPDETEAIKVVDELLDKKNQLGTVSAEVFNLQRKFDKIDDSLFAEFLSNDVNDIMHQYITQAGKKMAGVETFGVRSLKPQSKLITNKEGKQLMASTHDSFMEKWLKPIVAETRENGVTLTKADRKNITDLYKFATGEGVEYFEGKLGAIKDWTAVGYQVSMLPMATLSSVTELIIPFTKATLPSYLKGLSKGLSGGFKELSIGTLDMLKVKHNMTSTAAYREMRRFMIGVDQVTADSVERLSGDMVRGTWAKKTQNAFFKANFLTQWTRMVQAVSYVTGKDLIQQNLRKLAKPGVNLSSRGSIRRINELADLGIDYNKGIQWFNRGARKSDEFYTQNIGEAASIFTNDVILNTSREAGRRSHIMANPKTDLLFQFMGYPAVFGNTILKNMGRQLVEAPVNYGSKIAVGTLIMTEMARLGNWVRSQGQSEEGKTRAEVYEEAIMRWGGNGLAFDMVERSRRGVEALGPLGGVVAGSMGPIAGEAVSAFAYRKGPAGILGTKVPGFGAGRAFLGPDAMDDYSTWLRAQDKKLKELIVGD